MRILRGSFCSTSSRNWSLKYLSREKRSFQRRTISLTCQETSDLIPGSTPAQLGHHGLGLLGGEAGGPVLALGLQALDEHLQLPLGQVVG